MLVPPHRPRHHSYDQTLVGCIVCLLAIGLVMVYSASIGLTLGKNSDDYSFFYLIRHSTTLVVGVILAVIAFFFSTKTWQHYAPLILLLVIVLLSLVLLSDMGKEVNGSRRWLSLGLFTVQPSELMKLAIVLYTADYMTRKADWMRKNVLSMLRQGLFPILLVMLLTGGLLLLQPDFGAFAMMTMLTMALLFLGGFNWRLLLGLIICLAASFIALIMFSDYRQERIWGFLDPWKDPYGKGYQLSHSLIAFGRGSVLGVGLGASVEKLSYLPEAHTDFLIAILAEELGLIGVAIVIGLFAYLVVRFFKIGIQAAKLGRTFSALVAQGVAFWLGLQAIINMGVAMGLFPTKGLTLPLLSFGGSAMVANLMAVGIVLRIDYENRQGRGGSLP